MINILNKTSKMPYAITHNKNMAKIGYGMLGVVLSIGLGVHQAMAKASKSYSAVASNGQSIKAINVTHHCPRILQQPVNGAVLTINNTLRAPYCDYYLYPKPRQKIEIQLEGTNLSMQLIKPENHDFANGAYQTKSVGRHVIRVRYGGAGTQPKNIAYSFSLKVQ